MAELKPTPSSLPDRQYRLSNGPQDSDLDSPFILVLEPEPKPVFRLQINDLSHIASSYFLSLVDGSTVLPNALSATRKFIYPKTSPSGSISQQFHLPPTRSVTLVFRPMEGVAYTTGIDLDPHHHKEIHVNLNYIRDCTTSPLRRRDEIIGVITHELVHCYQYNGFGTCPGGLIEGIADFVRLKANLGPPHWVNEKGKRERGHKWDDGYQKTAFFLDWLEENHGKGTVGRINDLLRRRRYQDDEQEDRDQEDKTRATTTKETERPKKKHLSFWEELFGEGSTIDKIWQSYCKAVDDENDKDADKQDDDAQGSEGKEREGPGGDHDDEKPAVPIPTCDAGAAKNDQEKDIGAQSGVETIRKSSELDDVVVVEKE